jgi:small subunit ribosomal protein S20
VAHSVSAAKRVRQNLRRRAGNKRRKRQIKDTIRAFEQTLTAGDRKKAAEQLQQCYKKLDQIAAKGIVHKNAAARKKSRLAQKLNKAFA